MVEAILRTYANQVIVDRAQIQQTTGPTADKDVTVSIWIVQPRTPNREAPMPAEIALAWEEISKTVEYLPYWNRKVTKNADGDIVHAVFAITSRPHDQAPTFAQCYQNSLTSFF